MPSNLTFTFFLVSNTHIVSPSETLTTFPVMSERHILGINISNKINFKLNITYPNENSILHNIF